ncbi:MAG: hypothetical protein IAG10_32825 [Planctomycetaceae bacterium]|nr:hypothetical protein [Planctomycetaceae bacterium]
MPSVDREPVLAAIGDALDQLGYRIVHREEPSRYEDGFQYRSVQTIFVGPSGGSRWVPLSSWGDGLPCEFPDWYRRNPLAMSLSRSLSPIIYLFTDNAGAVAGYSIFTDGQQVEAQSLTPRLDRPLAESSLPFVPSEKPTILAGLLGDPEFDYEAFMRGFRSLEVAIAALAARLDVSVHLIDPLDVQDGEGAIVVEGGEYRQVSLPSWIGVYYEKSA